MCTTKLPRMIFRLQPSTCYPRERDVHGFLSAMVYVILGKYEKALEEATTVVAIAFAGGGVWALGAYSVVRAQTT